MKNIGSVRVGDDPLNEGLLHGGQTAFALRDGVGFLTKVRVEHGASQFGRRFTPPQTEIAPR
jgi:hypothetical protein